MKVIGDGYVEAGPESGSVMSASFHLFSSVWAEVTGVELAASTVAAAAGVAARTSPEEATQSPARAAAARVDRWRKRDEFVMTITLGRPASGAMSNRYSTHARTVGDAQATAERTAAMASTSRSMSSSEHTRGGASRIVEPCVSLART